MTRWVCGNRRNSAAAPRASTRGAWWAQVRLLALSLAVLGGCASQPDHASDPLVGKIFRAADLRELSREQLLDDMAAARIVYLGEIHENPWQHRIQLELVEGLIARGLRPAIGFEFFSLPQTADLTQYVTGARSPARGHGVMTESELRRRLGWGSARDREWAHYFPLIELARRHTLPVFGADLPAGLRQRLTRVGLDGLSPAERLLLEPTSFSDDAYRHLMFDNFTRGHCGWSEPALLQRLYDTWLARNDAMSAAVAAVGREHSGGPVVLVLGGGHTAYGMGVMERVEHRLPGIRQFNLGLYEAARRPAEAADYVAAIDLDGRHFGPRHAYFWITPRLSYDDPCERFAKQLKRHSKTPPTQ